jgi:hypothetical protein
MRRWGAVLLVVGLIAGCDGDDEDQFDADDPRNPVARYVDASNKEDAAGVCDLIAWKESGLTSSGPCEQGFEEAFARGDVPESDPEEVIGDVSIEGNTARVDNPKTGGYMDLVKVDGEWKLQLSD